MDEKTDYDNPIVLSGEWGLSSARLNLINRGLTIAESLSNRVVTVIKNILIKIDCSGNLRKNAVIDPVWINGEKISEIYLGFVRDQKGLKAVGREHGDFRIGDTISINNNEIVFFRDPKVIEKKRTGNEKLFGIPDKCPACGCKLELRDHVFYVKYCPQKDCPGKIKAKLIVFCNSMRIGINPEVANELVEKRKVFVPADIFFLKKYDLMSLDEMDEDLAETILSDIEKSRKPNLFDLITALLETSGVRKGLAIPIGVEYTIKYKSISNFFNSDWIMEIRNPFIGKTAVIEFQKVINSEEMSIFIDKLKKGGVIFP